MKDVNDSHDEEKWLSTIEMIHRRAYTRIAAIFVHSKQPGQERTRLALLTGISSLAARSISLAASLITVRWTLHYLGRERYGMWMTISSTIAMMGFADFGISNGVINAVAGSIGKGDRAGAKRVISSALWMLSWIALLLMAVFCVAYVCIDIPQVFNVHSALAIREATPTVLIVAACFLANVPLGTIRGTQTGMQAGTVGNLWSLAGTLASLIFMFFALQLKAGLPLLVAALSIPPVIASLVNGLFLFSGKRRDLMPDLKAVDRNTSRQLLHVGGMIFVMQLAISVGMQADNVVIAHILGSSAVPGYAVPARLFNTVNAILVMSSGAIWPAYADAFARGDRLWIRRAFKRIAIAGTVVTVITAGLLVLYGQRLVAIWVGPDLYVPRYLLAVFGIQCALYAHLQPIGFLLNGLSKYQIQASCAALMACANIALSIIFVSRIGIVGAVLGSVVSQFLFQVIPLSIIVKKELGRLQRDESTATQAENSVESGT